MAGEAASGQVAGRAGEEQSRAGPVAAGIRLGLYVDGAFRAGGVEGDRVFCGEELFGFMRFAAAVGQRFGRFVVLARGTGDRAATPFEIPAGVELARLPHYPSLREIGKVARALPATLGAMWRALDGLDAVWVSGVHPLGLLLAILAGMRRRRVILLIRQDSPRYFRSRLPSPGWRPLLAPLWLLDLAFRAIGRRVRTTVVGDAIARRYGAPRPNVLEVRVTLLRRADLAAKPRESGWRPPVRLLTVGRIEPEKSPLVAAAALGELERSDPGRYELTWVGEGRLAGELRAAAHEAGARLSLPGFVPFGPALLELYSGADLFVHTAVTEGVPGVLFEAMGAGLPIVATEVGGVRAALADGEAGLLVPPGDPAALADAVRRFGQDPSLRHRLARGALRLGGAVTIESESDRVARFIANGGEELALASGPASAERR